MDQSTTIAPAPMARHSAVRRAVSYLLRPLVAPVRNARLVRKWSHHADPRTLDWGWGTTHYNRVALVNLLLSKFQDPAYLEIGCDSNALFDSVPARDKIGVDPSRGGTIRATSDDFFATNHAQFDVIFIDGLHTYEQVRQDIDNALRCVRKGGWIAIHDMLPSNWVEQHIPVIAVGAWTGDVWKVAFELMQTRGIEFKILKIDHGIGVIKVIEPGVTSKDLRHELAGKEFSYFCDNVDRLPVTEWDEAQAWLRS